MKKWPGRFAWTLLGIAASLILPALKEFPGVPEAEDDGIAWFNLQRTYPTGSYPANARKIAYDEARKRPSARFLGPPNEAWRSIGPQATYPKFPQIGLESGVIFVIAVSPADPRIILIGGDTGGIWRSADGGNSFVPVSDNQVDLAVGSIAFAKSNPSIVYAGMGGGLGDGEYLGAGVLKSTDAGVTWNSVSNASLPTPAETVALLVDPNDSNRLLLAQYSHLNLTTGSTFSSGFLMSTDGGVSWVTLFQGLPRSLVQNVANPQILYMGMTRVDQSANLPAGLYQSTNEGKTWTNIFTSPFTNTLDIQVAVTPADANSIYICTAGYIGATFDARLITSKDGGATWSSQTLTTIDTAQFSFSSYVRVAPDDPKTIYIGTRDVYKSTDGGATWTDITNAFTPSTNGSYSFTPWTGKLHTDQRGFAFSPNDPGTIYFGCDGGLWKSSDRGNSFLSLNATLSLTQLYSLTVSPSGYLYAGAQDNGFQQRFSGSQTWQEFNTGDVGAIVVDPIDPTTVFTVDDRNIFRYINSGRTSDKMVGTSATFGELSSSPRIAFVPPLASNGVDQTLYFGTWRLFISSDLGNTWTSPSSTDLTKGVTTSGSDVLSSIAVAPTNSKVIYTGSSFGRSMASQDGGATWTDITTGLPNRFIKSIVVDYTNPAVVYLSVSGFTTGHIFKSVNFGSAWTDISGDLPNIPTSALLLDPSNPGLLYAGTDVGVFTSQNGGANWIPLMNGMPPVIISALAAANGEVYAATFGRGVYEYGSGKMSAVIGADQIVSTTTSGQGALSVGYAQLSSALTQLSALANFGYTQNGVLVTEAGVPAASPIKRARLFVDYSATTNSGIALVNPGTSAISITAELRDPTGALVASAPIQLSGWAHNATFVDQVVKPSSPFLGTLSLTSSGSFAAVNLSSAFNSHGEPLFSALPVVDLDHVTNGANAVLPHIVNGGGIAMQILMMNPDSNAISGTIALYNESGSPMALDFGQGPQSLVNYNLAANGMIKLATAGVGAVQVGYAVITPSTGTLPVSNGIFLASGGTGLASQAGVPSAPQTTSAMLFVDLSSVPLNRNTGIALVNPNKVTANINMTFTGIDGQTLTTTLNLAANSHVAKFVNQLFPTIGTDRQGVLALTSNVSFAPLTLRLTTNQRGDPIYSTLPVADLTNLPSGPFYLPQIADGGGYQTQIILINTSSASGSVLINAFDNLGNAVTLR